MDRHKIEIQLHYCLGCTRFALYSYKTKLSAQFLLEVPTRYIVNTQVQFIVFTKMQTKEILPLQNIELHHKVL